MTDLGPHLVAERSARRIPPQMPKVVHVELILVDDFDVAQPLGVEDTLEAGDDEAHRKPLLRPQGLAVHAVGDDDVGPSLC